MDEQLAIHVSQSDQVCYNIPNPKYSGKSFNSMVKNSVLTFLQFVLCIYKVVHAIFISRKLTNVLSKNNLIYQQSLRDLVFMACFLVLTPLLLMKYFKPISEYLQMRVRIVHDKLITSSNGWKKKLSLGYTCDFFSGRQRNGLNFNRHTS